MCIIVYYSEPQHFSILQLTKPAHKSYWLIELKKYEISRDDRWYLVLCVNKTWRFIIRGWSHFCCLDAAVESTPHRAFAPFTPMKNYRRCPQENTNC